MKIGLAVSGGGDSLAMLYLMADWAKNSGCEIEVATVDHQLREGSLNEAKDVADQCAKLNLNHHILTWTDWDGQGNLQEQARHARQKLLSNWAMVRKLDAVCLGHTSDDVAETFLMRLSRGSGLAGLSAMAKKFRRYETDFYRPLLTFSRASLRAYLKARDITWIDDPSNDDQQFDRVKIRKALPLLEDMGISTTTLSETATRLASSRATLEKVALEHAKQACIVQKIGAVKVDLKAFRAAASTEVQTNLIAKILIWIAELDYPPRRDALELLLEAIDKKEQRTLAGCIIHVGADHFEIAREPNAMPAMPIGNENYDNRWKIEGANNKGGLEIRPLGQKGMSLCKTSRPEGYSKAALMASPSIWDKTDLIAAPFAGKANGWSCHLIRGHHSFFTSFQMY